MGSHAEHGNQSKNIFKLLSISVYLRSSVEKTFLFVRPFLADYNLLAKT